MAPKVRQAQRAIEKVKLKISLVDEDSRRHTINWTRPINEKSEVVTARLLKKTDHVFELFLKPQGGERQWRRLDDDDVWSELPPTRYDNGRKVYIIECADVALG